MQKTFALTLAILCVAAIAVLVLYQGGQQVQRQLEPRFGRECFAAHQAVLPPGSQYEGFHVSENRVVVKVMTGVDLRTIECLLGPDDEWPAGEAEPRSAD